MDTKRKRRDPYISKEIVEYLDRVYPAEPLPPPSAPQWVWVAHAARREVVNRLRQLYEKQSMEGRNVL